MKRLAILCALACALVACDKQTMNTNEKENEIKTVSFYTEMRTRYYSPKFLADFQDIIGSGEDEVAKDGMIYLVAKETWDMLKEQSSSLFYPGSWKGSPIEENYFDNKYDLIAEFQAGIWPAVATIPATHGHLNNIPLGQYVLVGALGIYRHDTLKTYRGSFRRMTIDSSFACDSTVLKVVCSGNEIAFWQDSELMD